MTADASAIVLAGGRASRFGSDKLMALVDGRPLLDHVLAAIAAVAADVLVVVASDRPTAAVRGMDLPGVRVIADPRPDGGPMVGLRAGAAAARRERLVVVGGDMPWLVPAVLRLLLAELVDPGVRAAALEDAAREGTGSTVHPLPIAVRRSAVIAHHEAHPDRRSLRQLLADLDVRGVRAAAWRAADPDGMTVRDVDRPDDLTVQRRAGA